MRSGLSDDDGRFRIVGVDSVLVDGEPVPGHYRITVRSDGVATWFLPASWDPNESDPVETFRGQTVTLPPALQPAPVAVSGRVTEPGGLGLAGADVSLYAGLGGTLQAGATDPEGRYTFPEVWGARLELTVAATGYASTIVDEIPQPEPGASVELDPIQLQPEAVLSGAVDGLDDAGGSLSIEDEVGRAVARLGLGGATTSYRLDGLPAGSWTVRFTPATSSDLQAWHVEGVVLAAGEESALDLSLSLGAGVVARVRRRAGEPLAGVELQAIDPGTGLDLPRGRATSDGEGSFVLRGLPPGGALFRASWTPFCSTDPTWVQTWAFDARHEGEAEVIPLEAGADLDLGELLLPPDRDTDGMDDIWELAWGLDRSRADGADDPDADGRANLQEYLDRTDPRDPDRSSGCSTPGSAGRARPVTLGCLLLAVWLTRRRAGATILAP